MSVEMQAGLSSPEAADRRARYGPNALPSVPRHALRAFLAKLSGPVAWMLEAALVLEAVLGKWIDATIILVLLLFNAALSFGQERRAQGTLELLRRRLHVDARARRDGRWVTLPASELVPGDLVHVRMGDLVPADLRLSDGELLLDQSTLTGESLPVERRGGEAAYSGAVVRHGEATGTVTATGARSLYGKTAELVRLAGPKSHLERLVLRIVKYLVLFDGLLAATVLAVSLVRGLPATESLPFALMLLIASVPVALPATFTLAGALGALDLARRGVLITRLAAIEEVAAMNVVCSDKTGTLTENRLSVAAIRPLGDRDAEEVLRIAAAACDEASQDPLDLAILRALGAGARDWLQHRTRFVPFDPATKRAEAEVEMQGGGGHVRVVKGAPVAIGALLDRGTVPPAAVDDLARDGNRVLAVAAGGPGDLQPVGLLGFLDPPREDAPALVSSLAELGVRTVMLTGDAPATARAVARRLGLGDRSCTIDEAMADPARCDLVANVLPEDKLRLVQAQQGAGAIVGMTGDGVNDAPALRQAEVGIAVDTGTDVAKSAASLVLTRPGLGGVVSAIAAGRRIYQRMLTYTLNKIVKTFEIALFLTVGFLATGVYVITPRLVLLLLFANDFVTMSIASDRVAFSRRPDRWRVRALVLAAMALAGAWLAFSLGAFYVGRSLLRLPLPALQTLSFVALVFGGQANVYAVRERRHLWRSRPGAWMLVATAGDVIAVGLLAWRGILMARLPFAVIGACLAAALVFLAGLDTGKVLLFRKLHVA